MKKILILNSLLIINILSGCATQSYQEPTITKEEYHINKVVIAQICLPKFNYNNDYISGNLITENKGYDNWNTYLAPLEGITKNYHYIFKANLGNPLKLHYYTVISNEGTDNSFTYKRDFSQYELNKWSQWEEPDFVFSANDIPTFSLQKQLLLTPNPNLIINKNETPKVRFKIMKFNDYVNEIKVQKIFIAEKNMNNCS